MIRSMSAVLVAATCAAACGMSRPEAQDGIERLTAGDTLIVRNHAPLGAWGDTMTVATDLVIGAIDGAPELLFGNIISLAARRDGSILVLDQQARQLREFDANGRYVRTMGRPGSGPGELQMPMAVRVDPHDRAYILEANRRVTIFDKDGSLAGTWQVESMRVSYDLPIDTAGNVYVMVQLRPPVASAEAAGPRPPPRLAYVRYTADGVAGDTLPPDGWVYEPSDKRRITIASGYDSKENFVPLGMTQIHPTGAIVTGNPTSYAIDMYMPAAGGPMRIGAEQAQPSVLRLERVTEPAPITAGEAAEWQAYIRALMERETAQRATVRMPPGVSLPPVREPYFPDQPVKPFYRWVSLGADGRVWVWRHATAVYHPPEMPPAPGALPVPNWHEPNVQDVFEPDGTFLGTVVVPHGYVIRHRFGDQVWGTMRDDLDVQYVFRARLVPRRQPAAPS